MRLVGAIRVINIGYMLAFDYEPRLSFRTEGRSASPAGNKGQSSIGPRQRLLFAPR
jgi:hypothetical protein